MSFNSLKHTKSFQSLHSKFRGVNCTITYFQTVAVLIISLLRKDFTFGPLNSQRNIENIVTSMIVIP